MSNTIQTEVETTLASAMPDVEVLLVEVVGGHTAAVFIDHPDGVTLALCEQVTRALERLARALRARGLLARHRAPADQARPLPPLPRAPRPRAHARARSTGHKTFTGELVGADDDEVTIAADSGVIAIPYADIHRSNLVEE